MLCALSHTSHHPFWSSSLEGGVDVNLLYPKCQDIDLPAWRCSALYQACKLFFHTRYRESLQLSRRQSPRAGGEIEILIVVFLP